MCILDIKSLILAKKIFGGSSSGGNTEPTIRGEREITDDWATIKAHSDNGTAQDVYQLGDFKYVDWVYNTTTTFKLKFIIVGFDCTADENGDKKGITFMQQGCWAYDYSSFVSRLPSELNGILKKTKHNYFSASKGVVTFTEETEYAFAPDLTNILENANTILGDSYSYYVGVESVGNSTFHYDVDEVFPLFKDKDYRQILRYLSACDGMHFKTRGGTTKQLNGTIYGNVQTIKVGESNFELSGQYMSYANSKRGIICFVV